MRDPKPKYLTGGDAHRARVKDETLRDPVFIAACRIAGVAPSRRQASKWCMGYGAAWHVRRQATLEVPPSAGER